MADAIVTVKTCRKCGASFSGRACRVCAKRYKAVYYLANRDKVLAARKDWREKHIEAEKASRKVRYASDPDVAKAATMAWRTKNPERSKAAKSAYYKENHQRIKSDRADWYKKNAKRLNAIRVARYTKNSSAILASNAAWRASHPETNRVNGHNYNARKRENGGKLSKGLAGKLFKLQRGKCACCGEPLGENYHLDHRIPLKRGGLNVDANMQLLRQRCNNQKKDKDPIEFMRSRGFLL